MPYAANLSNQFGICAQPKSYIQPRRDECEWECLPLKSSLLWPNHMLSLVSFRRPALFIKALDGYLSQHCRIHPQKLPSLLSTLLLSNLFLLSSNVDSPSCLPLASILPFPLSLIHPSLLNQTLKSPPSIFFSFFGFVSVCVGKCDSSSVKVDETGRIQIQHSCNCHGNNPPLFFPCGGGLVLPALSGFICIFVPPLFLLMNYLPPAETTAEITDGCCVVDDCRSPPWLFSFWVSALMFCSRSVLAPPAEPFHRAEETILLCCCSDYRVETGEERGKRDRRQSRDQMEKYCKQKYAASATSHISHMHK